MLDSGNAAPQILTENAPQNNEFTAFDEL